MRTSAKLIFGVVPACLLTLTGLLFFGLVATWYQKALLASAIIGTCGLLWSLAGYSRKMAVLVLVMLVVGIIGVLVGGLGGAISAFARAATNENLGPPGAILVRILIICWLTLGPTVVGFGQAMQAARVLRAVT